MTRGEPTAHIYEIIREVRRGDDTAANGADRCMELVDEYVAWVIGEDSHTDGRTLAGATIRDVINNVRAVQRLKARTNIENKKQRGGET